MIRKIVGKGLSDLADIITPKSAKDFLKSKGINNINDLKDMFPKELKKLVGSSTSVKKLLAALGIGGAGGAAAGIKFGTDIGMEKQKALDSMAKMNKGGIVAPKMGGKPSFKTKKSSKSIAKKYFKGTFQLVELTKAVKHILRKIDSEIESRKNAFADGKIIKDNFEKSVGQVRGLVLAKEIVRETAKNIEELDD